MNSYLHFLSYHPHHLRVNIPYGQFLRIKRNSTNIKDYRQHSSRLAQQFLDRGYPYGIVQAASRRAEERDRELLEKQGGFSIYETSLSNNIFSIL